MKKYTIIKLLLLWQASCVTPIQILLIGESWNPHLFAAAQLGAHDFFNGSISFKPLYVDQSDFLYNVCQLPSSSFDGVIDLSADPIGSDDIAMQLDAILMTMKDWLPYLPPEMYSVPTVKTTSSQYIESVIAFINSLNGTIDSVLIIFSTTFDGSLLFPSQGTNRFIPVYMQSVNSSTVSAAISLIQKLRVSEIILACELDLGSLVISQAINAGILNGIYHWYFITKYLTNFACPTCNSGKFLLFQKVVGDSALFSKIMRINSSLTSTDQAIEMIYAYQTGQVLSTLITQSQGAGTWNGSSSSFSCWNSSSLSSSSYRYNMGLTMAMNLYTPGLLGVIAFNHTNRNQFAQISISEVSVGSGSTSIVNNIMWTRSGSLAVNNISSNTFIVQMLKVLVIQEPPFVIKLPNGSFIGYSIDIVAYLAKAMNFQYQIFEQLDSQYGIVQRNGSFNGLIGAIASNQYDMGIGAITITSDREQVVDFSIPYYDYSSIQILMKVVTVNTVGDQLFFLKAFTWDVWVTVIATIIITGLLITFVDRVSPFSFQNRLKNDEIRDGEADGKIFTMKESMWFVLGAYTQAGESFDPRSISCRVIVVGLWLFSYLMMAMYTANLAAQLTVAQLASRPASLSDLAAQQTMVYTTQANTTLYDYFYRMQLAEADIFQYWTDRGISNINNPAGAAQMSTWQYPVTETYTNMFSKMSAWGFTANISDSINNIINNDWALFLETPIIKYYTNMDCRLVATGDPFSQRPYGIVLQRNSPLLNNLNLQILIMQENRILEDLKVKWWNNNSVSCNTDKTTSGLGLDTLGGAFVFLAIGIFIAGIIFIGEKIVAHVWGTGWAKAHALDPTVVRPMGMMSTVNVNVGSHVEIHRIPHHGRRESEMHHPHPAKLSIPTIEEDIPRTANNKPQSSIAMGEINRGYDIEKTTF